MNSLDYCKTILLVSKVKKKKDLQQKTEMNNYGAAGRIINEENINGITCGNEDQDLVLIRQ